MNSNMLFYFFSFLLIISAVFVISSKHPVFSLLFLVSCFLLSSFLLFLLECEFLALLFIVVYVGAVAVFILFAVMMLESKSADLSRNLLKYLPVSFIFGFLLFIPISSEIFNHFNINILSESLYSNKWHNLYDLADSYSDVRLYGVVLYSYYVVHFLISGFILLLVLVGVVYLTNIFNNKETLAQSEFKQLSRHSKFFLRN